MSDELKPCPFCGGEAVVKHIDSRDDWWIWCRGCDIQRPSVRNLVHSSEEAIAAWNQRAGSWQPVRFDDPNNDGPVWVDENGCVCWAGANGETQRLVLHGDMRLCLYVEEFTL